MEISKNKGVRQMKPNFVYVVTIETYYQVMAVDTNRDKAIRLAASKALEYLKDAGVSDFKTQKQIIDYFSPSITKIEIGTAKIEG
jgi:hypothetical protein